MPFDQDTKARMFIRSGRLCCLCLKQCGTNIEAAHIVAEAAGGSNDEDNGIPLCFDCHQETGAYDNKHPKGNKFTVQELKARRNRLYQLVESGALYAQIIAGQHAKGAGQPVELPSAAPVQVDPSRHARVFATTLRDTGGQVDAVGTKLALFGDFDRAFILDSLLDEASQAPAAVAALGTIARSGALTPDEIRILAEQLVRSLALLGTLPARVELLRSFPQSALSSADEVIRRPLAEELISIVHRDQYGEVNDLVPVLVQRADFIPPDLYPAYVRALVDQAESASYRGAPAARSALRNMPPDIARAGLASLTANDLLFSSFRTEQARQFISRYEYLAEGNQHQMLRDFLDVAKEEFAKRYSPW